MHRPKKILVAPLNWGLGHATRCIPVIEELIRQGASVFLASDGRSLELLKTEFPTLPTFQLPGYGITYQSKDIVFDLLRMLPGITLAIYREHQKIREIVMEHQVDGLISDNRMGCFSKKTYTAFLTHQINLIAPFPVVQWCGRQTNYFFIRQFDECWVPDSAAKSNLSGSLSHGTPMKNIHFLGALSRFQRGLEEKKYDAIAVMSGPEPQRTKLENIIVKQAAGLPYRFLIVQGKTERTAEQYKVGNNIQVVSALAGEALNKAILASDLFIGRAGYSSIMDLARLSKPALLIPTPGQTEQEYLADYLAENGVFHFQKQTALNLEKDILAVLAKKGLHGSFFDETGLQQTVGRFLARCRFLP